MRSTPMILVAALSFCACEVQGPEPVQPAESELGTARWAIEHVEPGGAIVSVWGSSPTDVWAVGGQAGRGLILHSDGLEWTPVDTGVSALLWWVYGFGKDDVYAVGEGGVIMHWDGETWARVPSGTDKTLYGLWGETGGDVWIVGGEPWGPDGGAVLLRGQGRTFAPVTSVPADLLPDTLFKVYGSPTDDVIAVGSGGAILRYGDGEWTRDDVPTDNAIVSLWGRGNDLYAVGGGSQGEMLHYDGGHWTPVSGIIEGPSFYGVYTSPGQPVFAVGAGPRVVEVTPGAPAMELESLDLDPSLVLHSVWGDGAGSVYAVGGSLMAYPNPMSGIIVRRQ